MRKGFTIVELLIVIVVIAILAAVTVVAFNGIQQRARESDAKSALANAERKLAMYHVDNASYPTTGNLADAGIDNNDTRYQYTSDGDTFCITASSNDVHYHSSDSVKKQSGACSGHIASGETITNYAVNPSGETNTYPWGSWVGSGPTRTVTQETNGGYAGNGYVRLSLQGEGNGGGLYYSFRDSVGTRGVLYRSSFFVRASKPMEIMCRWYPHPNEYVTLTANTWTQIGCTGDIELDRAGQGIEIYRRNGTDMTWNAGDWFDVDSTMITEGTAQHTFADGDTPGWNWNGTPGESTSTGPAL